MLLKTGDKGIQVTYLQYALHIMCCSPGGIDGTFGAGTEAAVRKYQERIICRWPGWRCYLEQSDRRNQDHSESPESERILFRLH